MKNKLIALAAAVFLSISTMAIAMANPGDKQLEEMCKMDESYCQL